MLFSDHFKSKFDSEVKACTLCVHGQNRGPILGYGEYGAPVMFIGDAPCSEDFAHSIPFTGKAKRRMRDAIRLIGLEKGQYYMTYFIKHEVTDKKTLGNFTAIPCAEILLREIEQVNPWLIVSMGFYVTKALTKVYKMDIKDDNLRDIHGNAYIANLKTILNRMVRPKRMLIPTWNPSVDNPVMNQQFIEDMETVKTVYKFGQSILGDPKVRHK